MKFNPLFSLVCLLVFGSGTLFSQTRFMKSSGTVSFFSSAPLEDITAKTESFSSGIDLEKGTVSFSVPITGFIFRKSLMRQHFNEQYMESEKYPSAFFTGKFEKIPLALPVEGSILKTRVKGMITIKGRNQELNEEVSFSYNGNELAGTCKFKLRVADFDIKIPRIFIQNIAEVVEVTINANYKRTD